MRCSLLIGGQDLPYLKGLVRYLMEKSRYSFNITFLETIESFDDLATLDSFHLLLFERTFLKAICNAEDRLKDHSVLVLDEVMVEIIRYESIFKYQKAETICEQIFAFFIAETNEETLQHKAYETKVIGCYSPMGGCGNTMIAQMIAAIKSGIGKKVLFFSLDLFFDYKQTYESSGAYNLSDYSTYLRTNENWLVGLELMVSIDSYTGIRYLKTPNHMQDMLDFQKDLFDKWLKHIRDYGDFDYIVLDFARYAVADLYTNLKSCNEKIITSRIDVCGLDKCRRFIKDMKMSGDEEYIEEAMMIGNQLMEDKNDFDSEWDLNLKWDESLYKKTVKGRRFNSNAPMYKKMEAFIVRV